MIKNSPLLVAGVGHSAPAGGNREGFKDGGGAGRRLGRFPTTKPNHPSNFPLQALRVGEGLQKWSRGRTRPGR